MSGLRLEVGDFAARIEQRRRALLGGDFPARLAAGDDTLWGADDRTRSVARNRLGWVRSAFAMRERVTELRAFAREVTDRGFRRALLLGMGGSSLAPEVLATVFGARAGGLPLGVLDNTSPAAVAAAEEAHDPATTLVLVASKSGGTIEVSSFERAFFARARTALGDRAGSAFVAITDPGTALEAQARAQGYLKTFSNPADIGGRYSVLSCFGLVPAALLGLDPAELCERAIDEHAAFAASGGDALTIGAALGELAMAGRGRLTLVMSPELGPLGAWIEQLVAESTGKDGRGILPVDGERLGDPGVYDDTRVFVSVSLGDPPAETTRALDALAAAGHPVLRWRRERREDLGAEFLRWQLATAVAGAVIGVNPFDEPNVAEAKAATRAVLERVREHGEGGAPAPRSTDGGLELHAPLSVAAPGTFVTAWARGLMDLVGHGRYAAVLAFLHRTDHRHAALERVRHAWRDGTRAPATLGYGPRYLHSTGQLHKGGPAAGVFLQITGEEGDVPIPGEWYGFQVLRDAQAAGDFEVLAKHGLPVARIHIRGDVDAGLARLANAFEAAARAGDPHAEARRLR